MEPRRHWFNVRYECGHTHVEEGFGDRDRALREFTHRAQHACPPCLSGRMSNEDWYEVSHACGHVITTEIGGRHETRQQRADRRGARKCKTCEKEEREATFQQNAADAVAWATERKLPELEGTSRQVGFANIVRADLLKTAYTRLVDPPRTEDIQTLGQICDAAGRWTDARFWIEYMDSLSPTVIEADPMLVLDTLWPIDDDEYGSAATDADDHAETPHPTAKPLSLEQFAGSEAAIALAVSADEVAALARLRLYEDGESPTLAAWIDIVRARRALIAQ